jgi:Outer membrane protein beta-barrel domain
MVLLGMSNVETKSPSQNRRPAELAGSFRFGKTEARWALRIWALLLLTWQSSVPVQAQLYAGVLGGVSSLSGDTRSLVTSDSVAFSSYDPKNGGEVSLLFGKHFSDYFSAQASYTWNENELSLSAGSSGSGAPLAYQETRSSSQQTVLGNVLVYFRARSSRLRPYLSVGSGFVHFGSTQENIQQVLEAPILPPHRFSAKRVVLNVPVGMDLNLGNGWAFRYTFSETISTNPISKRLSPSGQHTFKNFQNLFGFVRRFWMGARLPQDFLNST